MRYFIGFLAVVILLILLIVLLFRSNNGPTVPSTTKPLISYANTNAEVSYTLDYPTSSNLTHTRIIITVSQFTVTYQQQLGYDGNIVNQQQYPNTENAYLAFLNALQGVGFTLGVPSKTPNEEQQHCAQGDRYIYEITQGSNTLERFWATSCNGPHTYNGLPSLTNSIFQAQVPDYNSLIRGTSS
jgi:hypothetical protein